MDPTRTPMAPGGTGTATAPPVDADHESASMMTEELEEKTPEDGAMKIDSLNVRIPTSGGFIVQVSKSPVTPPKDGAAGPGWKSEEHVFGSFDELVAFAQKELVG